MSVRKVLLFLPFVGGYTHPIEVRWLKLEFLDLNYAHQMICTNLDAPTCYSLPSYNDWS